MSTPTPLSPHGRVLLALCGDPALTPRGLPPHTVPLTVSEWTRLARRLSAAGEAAALLEGLHARKLVEALDITELEAGRLTRLLTRLPGLDDELERLQACGIWAVTVVDPAYPASLRLRLGPQAPLVLFGAGDPRLAASEAVAVVGSRDIGPPAAEFARLAANKLVHCGVAVASGGARGTDRIAMETAMELGGVALGVLAESLDGTIRKPGVGGLLGEGRLLLLAPGLPNAPFSAAAALGRNKLIYALSRYAIVVSSDYQVGGTWSGAVEAIRSGWCPVFVRQGNCQPQGNRELLRRGAVPLPETQLASTPHLLAWMREHAGVDSGQGDLLRETPRTIEG